MNFNKLTKTANFAKNKITSSRVLDQKNPIIISIIQQLSFITKHSCQGVDPRTRLRNGQTFTYSVLASRELCSPEELKIKQLLDAVSHVMYSDDY
ncbi:hypothetical protein KO527_03345 [Pseudoalteromonas sp. C2R02]|uniref:hypothetical protein n=1 Tax=Pseudoalteromonas sp. C2R02 TaxID=2841565 RepID=UPI001C092EF7|nr:hypothetical protein [Pseudoalteromonas sp. C2R02]MBU2968390.1 hypothetical protein [Pseudoalteromonas sp. C2R02]